MGLVELSNGQIQDFPRRLFEAFIKFSYEQSTQPGFAADIELMYMVNGQAVYINEIPEALHNEFVIMLAQFGEAISKGEVNPQLSTAETLVGVVLADIKRHGHA